MFKLSFIQWVKTSKNTTILLDNKKSLPHSRHMSFTCPNKLKFPKNLSKSFSLLSKNNEIKRKILRKFSFVSENLLNFNFPFSISLLSDLFMFWKILEKIFNWIFTEISNIFFQPFQGKFLIENCIQVFFDLFVIEKFFPWVTVGIRLLDWGIFDFHEFDFWRVFPGIFPWISRFPRKFSHFSNFSNKFSNSDLLFFLWKNKEKSNFRKTFFHP